MNGEEPLPDRNTVPMPTEHKLGRDDVLKLLEAADMVLDRARDAAQGELAGQSEKDAYELALKAKLALMQELKLRQLTQEYTDPRHNVLRVVRSKDD